MAAAGDAPTTMPIPVGFSKSRLARSVDPWILAAAVALLAVGTVMVYSATAVRSVESTGSSTGYLIRHVVSIAIGLVGMFVMIRIPTERWSKWTYPILVGTLLLLIAVFIPGVGRRVNGALRWISLGPVRIQPGELSKLAVIIYLSHSLAKKRDQVKTFSVGFLPHVLVCSTLVAFVIAQPDFGTSMIVMTILGLMLFVAGTKIGYLVLGVVLAIPAGYTYVASHPHAWARLLVFLDPEAYRSDIGYQVWESLVAFGSGGATGVGLGAGRQKLYFLPESHTDFVFAVVGEELGFVGACFVFLAFAVLIGRGMRVAVRSSCRFPMYLAFGITSWFGIQALTNMSVVTALVPTKGLTLPFVSYGGSSMISVLVALGVLLRCSAEASTIVRQDGRPTRNQA
ncbi:MAG: putative lipid II flippase FtsW [Deltaproteobacteria bacterium]|nr:putative lipid II flippase FtsW [Deltaproteobacteria bacterium]